MFICIVLEFVLLLHPLSSRAMFDWLTNYKFGIYCRAYFQEKVFLFFCYKICDWLEIVFIFAPALAMRFNLRSVL